MEKNKGIDWESQFYRCTPRVLFVCASASHLRFITLEILV